MKNTLSLRYNYEFSRVYKHGKYIPGRYAVLHFIKNRNKSNRLGITTARKVRGSVPRNRIRRLLRETYRLRECNIKKGYDIVLLGRENPGNIKQAQMDKDLVYLFKKALLWEELDTNSPSSGGGESDD